MEELIDKENPGIREESGRNPDGTFKPGFSGNPNGRPKDTLKEYAKRKLIEMTPEEKERFLEKISPELLWQMAEGRPKQDTDITSDGKELNTALVKFINGEQDNNNRNPDRV